VIQGREGLPGVGKRTVTIAVPARSGRGGTVRLRLYGRAGCSSEWLDTEYHAREQLLGLANRTRGSPNDLCMGALPRVRCGLPVRLHQNRHCTGAEVHLGRTTNRSPSWHGVGTLVRLPAAGKVVKGGRASNSDLRAPPCPSARARRRRLAQR
jgi:hypothetical protein